VSPKKIKQKKSLSKQGAPLESIEISQQSRFSGPIPPPEILDKYNSIIPNGAERIMSMAERQSAHRIMQEAKVISASSRDSFLGIVSGLIISTAAFIIAGFGFYLGHPVAAATICTVDLAAIVGVFIYGTKSKSAFYL